MAGNQGWWSVYVRDQGVGEVAAKGIDNARDTARRRANDPSTAGYSDGGKAYRAFWADVLAYLEEG